MSVPCSGHSQLWLPQYCIRFLLEGLLDVQYQLLPCFQKWIELIFQSFRSLHTLSPAILVSQLPFVIQHCRMSELGETLKIIKSNTTDKEIQAQKVSQFFQNPWEGDLMSPSPKFSFALQSSIYISPP